MRLLENLEPKAVFGYFEDICSIPHGSGNMEQISEFCVNFAKEHGLACIQDEMKNVIIIKEATSGYEEEESIILQGHLDMVCEKRPEKEKDFLTEGLELCTDGNLIWADGTTLGGDDGIAVAFCLAVLAAKDLKHPRLEVVLTVDEETGLYGAEAIDVSMLKGKKLINIDSEEEGILLTSCAGGLTLNVEIPVERAEVRGMLCEIQVTGLLGGHSGVEIHKGRANANVVLGRVLHALEKEVNVEILSMEGGRKDNAIPRLSKAKVLVNKDQEALIREILKKQEEILKRELHASDPEITLMFTAFEEISAGVLDRSSKEKAVHALLNIPNGIQSYSMDVDGLVETSLNMGIMVLEGETLGMSFAVRSCVESSKYHLTDRVCMFAKMLGGTAKIRGDYPGWEYRPNSKLRDTFVNVYEKMYGRKPEIQAIHAGLECGMFAGKIKDLDCISFGPNMQNVHTFEETLEIASVKRTWEYLCQILAEKHEF